MYRDFSHVGDLYLEIEDRFDGFAVSGPIPKKAITKKTEIQINSLKKDEKSYEGDLEDIARKRLNMVKPNETVYVDINR
ncbi:FtsB family cell division protein [Clostridioides difficile]|uniref:FtsB family cell division protein n=1 Tax=Clostridioides difficile TaxID=1496 RepID=UPI0020B3CC00|nr:septum formation initiator family protein [Clostridioides difficile]